MQQILSRRQFPLRRAWAYSPRFPSSPPTPRTRLRSTSSAPATATAEGTANAARPFADPAAGIAPLTAATFVVIVVDVVVVKEGVEYATHSHWLERVESWSVLLVPGTVVGDWLRCVGVVVLSVQGSAVCPQVLCVSYSQTMKV